MKKISVVVPTYNEEENVMLVYESVVQMFKEQFPDYDYDIIFVDNHSSDSTRELICNLYNRDSQHIKAIFNARNFGQARSHFYGLTQADGDCAILLHADLQNPISAVIEFVRKWEQGAKVVVGVYDNSMESPILTFFRTVYYKIMRLVSDVKQIEHFSDFELLDRDFLNVLKELHDPSPYLRGIVAELGFHMEEVHYTKNLRQGGKTHANIFTLYDFAMNGVTSYSKGILRIATVMGGCLSGISIIIALITLIQKLLYWNDFQLGIAAMIVGGFFLLSINLFFLGLIGEYILSINIRVLDRPLVIVEERLGFDECYAGKV